MKIKEDVYSLDATQGTLAFVVHTPEAAMLIDTGRPGQGKKILQELDSYNIQPQDIKHILLTHHDIDHIGNAALLQRASGAKVWISSIDLPYMTGEKRRHGIKSLISFLMKAELPENLHPYPPENELESFKIIPTPGHTPGHVCILYQDVLFAGDLVMGGGENLNLSPGIMTWDGEKVKESAREIAAIPFQWICQAHGQPMKRENMWDKFQ